MYKLKNILLGISILLVLTACNGDNSNSSSSNEDASNDYPNKTITLIVPFSAGGVATTTARTAAEYAGEELGETIVIENREGSGGATGQSYVANAEPDGYTLLLSTSSLLTNAAFNDVSYDADSFEHISQLTGNAYELVGINEDPYNDIDSFLAYAKENPGEILVGNAGTNTLPTIQFKQWAEDMGIEVSHIPFEGSAEVVTAAAGKHINAMIGNASDYSSQVESDKLVPILSFNENGSELYPDLKTSVELGSDIEIGMWRGISAPAGTDPEILKILEEAFKKATENEGYQKDLENLGIGNVYLNSADFTDIVQTEKSQLSK